MHPVLFELFGEPVHLYAVMIAMGFVVGIWLAARYGERVGEDRDLILDLCWWLLVSGLVGSRIVFIFSIPVTPLMSIKLQPPPQRDATARYTPMLRLKL